MCPSESSEQSSPYKSKRMLKHPSGKRVSIMLDDGLLLNGYPSLLTFGSDQDLKNPVRSSLMNSLYDTLEAKHYKAKLELNSNSRNYSLSDISDSYEMIEYGLTPLEMKTFNQSRRKSCLCWHPNVVFNGKEDMEFDDFVTQELMPHIDDCYRETDVKENRNDCC